LDHSLQFKMNKKLLNKDIVQSQHTEDYIKTGYRYPHSSIRQTACTMFMLHNETVNIWTHFIPFLICLYVLINRAILTTDTYWYPLLLVLMGSTICFLSSSLAHLFSSMSVKSNHIWFIIDYSGVSGSFMSTSIATAYYNRLFNFPSVYIVCINMCVTLIALVLASIARLKSTPILRVISFGICFIFCVLPTHLNHFFIKSSEAYTYHLLVVVIIILVGIFYTSKIPECYFPGKFDYTFNSHQIVHVLVILLLYTSQIALEIDATKNKNTIENDKYLMPNFQTTFVPYMCYLAAEWVIVYLFWLYLKLYY
jgi:predicted membrane channel-forming protein YqfA (hemolysin III family)